MALHFDAIPGRDKLPSFRDVTDLATIRLRQFFQVAGVEAQPAIQVQLERWDTHEEVPLNLTAPFRWSQTRYTWFQVPLVAGGTLGTMHKVQALTRKVWSDQELAECLPLRQSRASLIRSALDIGYGWSFKRSAGQYATTAIAYGYIAAAVAELTGGWIDSTDSGDQELLPATAEEFYGWYMRPERATNDDLYNWYIQCRTTLASNWEQPMHGFTEIAGRQTEDIIRTGPR